MTKFRTAARIDDNQKRIVSQLRQIPGITVQPGHDDILVGFQGKTFWYEVKNPKTLSKKNGEIIKSEVRESQIKLKENWKGHYKIVSSIEDIIQDLNQ